MNKPKMILFDYGETLVRELYFDDVKGIDAVLEHATANPHGKTGKELVDFWQHLYALAGRPTFEIRDQQTLEISNQSFQRHMFAYWGIEIPLTPQEIENIYWDTAAPGVPTDSIVEFLSYLNGQGIRTGVISNLTYSGEALKQRLNRILPGHPLEFLLASCDYVFRKPHPAIFNLALQKAGLGASDVWYCGDNPICDIGGAHSVGMQPILYRHSEPAVLPESLSHIPYISISHWEQLRQLIDTLPAC